MGIEDVGLLLPQSFSDLGPYLFDLFLCFGQGFLEARDIFRDHVFPDASSLYLELLLIQEENLSHHYSGRSRDPF
ncbi:hypothetical protein ES703_67092 [subsurface metagenome]